MKKTAILLVLGLCLACLAMAADKPAYHLPEKEWRIRHGQLLRLPGKKPEGVVFFDLGECLLCHRPQKSCNPCHRKLGVGLVPCQAKSQGKGGS